jgi:RHS repeat-associated protein
MRPLIITLMLITNVVISTFSQSGPNPTVVGSLDEYVYYGPTLTSYYWEMSGGIERSRSDNNGEYRITIEWQYVGSHYLMLVDNSTGSILTQTYIDVINCTPPAAPPVPQVSANTCGPKTLSHNGSPGAGVTWYWQTSATGSSMTNSTSTFIAHNSATYYLRSYKPSCWGNSVAIAVTVNPVPAAPWPVIRESSNTCGLKTLTASPEYGPPPAGVSWNWQGTNPNGMNINDYANPFYPPASGTYYLRALNTTTGCWSTNSQSYTVTINSILSPPALSASSNACGPKTLSVNGTPPTGVTWYWQTSGSGTSTANSSPTFSATGSGTYYLRAYSGSGCWSSPSSITVSVENPAVPWAVVNTSSNICGTKILTARPEDGSPPAGVNWHWQGTDPNGTAMYDYANPYSALYSGTYYIRSKTASCWGQVQSISVTVNDPPTPTVPIISTNVCSTKILSKSGTPPAGVSWYWQGTNGSGTDYTSPTATAATFNAIGSGTYFLAARNSQGCWSRVPANVSVTVNQNPAAPPAPVASTNACYAKTLSKSGTAPAGESWYWQGLNSAGQDFTSATATALTYSVATTGTATHYLRARTTAGCWSPTASGKAVTVDNPSTPTPTSFSYCEWEPMPLTANYSSTLKWFTMTDQLITAALNYVPKNLSIGSYSYKVRNIGPTGCESPGTATVSLTVKSNCDTNLNWGETTIYTINPANGASVVAATTKEYTDGFMNVIQSQSKSLATNQVFATDNIYDNMGQLALTTLSAPINSPSFAYRYKFVTNPAGYKYSANDFDATSGTGSLTSQNPVGNGGAGTLGWYYSSANTLENQTPTTAFPYAREWSETGPDPRQGKSAGPGDQHRMGSGHEIVSTKALSLSSELSHYYAIRNHFITAPNSLAIPAFLGYKYITRDPDGKSVATFQDTNGNVIATALVTSVVTGTPPSYTYDNWSYAFYNDLGQLVATVDPNGVKPPATTYPTFVTLYKYDHLGRNIEVTTTDEGWVRYVYSTDGKIRFSQNQLQSSMGKFSYTNYDALGRPIESGEYSMTGTNPFVFEAHTVATPAANSVLKIVDNVGYTGVSRKIDATRCADYTFLEYDYQATDLPNSAPYNVQTYTLGQVVKSENAYSKTWYSYDEFGQLLWTKQYFIADQASLGSKTIEYSYDFLGNVTTIVFQKGQIDAFYHHYVYDADQRLSEVHTSKDGITKTLQAKYKYYLHGPLKRIELAGNKQGIDYLYNIHGGLKGINHGDPAKDPGLDGISGANVSFMKDVFGMTYHYYDNDYTGASYNAGSLTLTAATYPNQYGGNLRASSYHNRTEYDGLAGKDKKRIYGYQYDARSQLLNAQFGSLTAISNVYTPAFSDEQRENIPSYDKNGNINSLLRKGKSAQTIANYSYAYEPNTNRLDKVNNNGSPFLDYTYNTIGQLTQQTESTSGKTFKIAYTPHGLVKEVRDAGNVLLVSYQYDDKGALSKQTNYNAGVASKNTFYISDAAGNVLSTYEQPLPTGTVQLREVPIYGAGRIGVLKPAVNTYFYEVSDHLGNVRAVIGLPKTETFKATMESENSEEPPFKNIANTRVPFAVANATTPIVGTPEVVKLNKDKPAGPTIALPVSPGDVINMNVWAYYEAGTSNFGTPLSESVMLNAVALAFGGVSGGAGESGRIYSRVQSGFAGTIGTSGSSTLPSAFMTYIVYDKNFVRKFWGSKGVTAEGNMSKQNLVQAPVTIDEPGFIYISLYNRSDNLTPVYFDDFTVSVTHSPIVAGADYYPFGLPLDGKEITDEPYRYGYQGQFSKENETTGWNEFDLRMYDARIGRWISPDPYGQFASPYLAMGNAPNMHVDVDGGACCSWAELLALADQYAVTASKLYTISGIKGLFTAGQLYAMVTEGKVNGQIANQDPYQPTSQQLKRWNSSTPDTRLSQPNTSALNSYFANEPGLLEASIPIWGNGRLAGAAFAKGNYWTGAAYVALAISDVFLVKAIAVSLTKGAITLAAKYSLKKAVANPQLTMREAAAAIRVPKVAPMMQGKGIDRAFRFYANKNWILGPSQRLGILKMNPMNRGADMIGGRFIRGTWWDVTTGGAWQTHVNKYGLGGIPLLY